MCGSPSFGGHGETWAKDLEVSATHPGGVLRASLLSPCAPCPLLRDVCAQEESLLPPTGVWHLLAQASQSWVQWWGQKGDRFCPQDTQRLMWSGDTCLYTRRHVQESKTRNRDFPRGTVVKNPPANPGDMGSSPGLGRSHMPRSS